VPTQLQRKITPIIVQPLAERANIPVADKTAAQSILSPTWDATNGDATAPLTQPPLQRQRRRMDLIKQRVQRDREQSGTASAASTARSGQAAHINEAFVVDETAPTILANGSALTRFQLSEKNLMHSMLQVTQRLFYTKKPQCDRGAVANTEVPI
jgi:hypothetical protein